MTSQSELAYQQIKKMIFHMELLPGDRVSELQIATKLSISRTPIHDALRRLEGEGLLRLERNRGATVICFSEDEVREIGTLRLSQDILSMQLASYYGCASDFERLMALAEDCEEAASHGDVYGRIQKDIDFHLEISRISGNTHLLNQQVALYQQIFLIQISKYTDVEHSLLQINHHKPIVAAIRKGNIADIRRLCCLHVQNYYQINPYILSCYSPEV